MSRYFARVELHNAKEPEDYDRLHEALRRVGFKNCVVVMAGSGTETKRLPTGTYFSDGSGLALTQATDAVRSAANSTGFPNEIVCMQVDTFSTYLSQRC